ncbi:MAG: hypothetical protein N2442_10410 [Spirochaetes bacterium]|nr:hypothetical protein [Spirochaetota bacterium]
MTNQVSLKPNLLFYPLRSSMNNFPCGIEVQPSHLQEAWNLRNLEKEYEMWTTLHRPFPWAAEIYPDFPWMEAICGCTIRISKNGYSVYPLDSPVLTRDLQTLEAILSKNPWIDSYFTLLETVSQCGKFPIAIPYLTGPVHLLLSLYGKESLKQLLATDLRWVESIFQQLTSIYVAFYKKILNRITPTPLGYIAGGCFFPSPIPVLVLKDPAWMEFQHLIPMKRMFYEMLAGHVSFTVFLATPAPALRWFEPCESCIAFFKGIIVEKKDATLPWEDLVSIFRMIQAAGKTLILAGPPEMEDWEFAQRDLEPKNLMVLFYTSTFSEVRFWSEYLLGKNRRSH